MARRTPDVLEKLNAAIRSGKCEFMGSPYAHPMLPNYPEEDGLWSMRFSVDAYERILKRRPVSFWNPECGWRSTIPGQVRTAGYANMIGDFEAYSRSSGSDGKPLRPEIHMLESRQDPAFYAFDFEFDLPGDEPALHFPFSVDPSLPGDALRIFLRTDRIAQFGVRYFMGMEGYTLAKYVNLIRKYSAQPAGEHEGALIIFADDAEYVGTNGWFKLKYQNQPDNVFEATPESRQKLIDLISTVSQFGRFTSFEKACRERPALEKEISFDDDSAWHGARASTWAQTPMARLLRPWQDLVRRKLTDSTSPLDDGTARLAWFHLTNSYNSDGQWPPTIPDAPHIVHPFNYAFCFNNLLKAELLVGGVPREELDTDPTRTLAEVLGPQQALVRAKALGLLESGVAQTMTDARHALVLVEMSRDLTSIPAGMIRILHPAEYRVRAEALIEARRLVGGVRIEEIDVGSYLSEGSPELA
jgi:hypothetical protein